MRTIAIIASSTLIWSIAGVVAAPSVMPAAKSDSTAKVQLNAAQAQSTVPAAPVKQSSAEGSTITVARAAIATGLNGYEPINPGDSFPPDVKRVYCLSQIKGARDSMQIEHRWYWNDRLIASVPLAIKSINWNTYSIKTILPDMTGEWRVSIVNSQKEEVLQTLKFTVK
jgi:hypothetical protein